MFNFRVKNINLNFFGLSIPEYHAKLCLLILIFISEFYANIVLIMLKLSGFNQISSG